MKLLLSRYGPLPAPAGASGALRAVRGREKGPERPGLQTKEEKIQSLKPVFTRAAHSPTGVSIFSLLLLAIAIDDDRQRREKEQREKRDRHARPQRKPAGQGSKAHPRETAPLASGQPGSSAPLGGRQ